MKRSSAGVPPAAAKRLVKAAAPHFLMLSNAGLGNRLGAGVWGAQTPLRHPPAASGPAPKRPPGGPSAPAHGHAPPRPARAATQSVCAAHHRFNARLALRPNRLLDPPKPTLANRVWVSDITYTPLANGSWAYLWRASKSVGQQWEEKLSRAKLAPTITAQHAKPAVGDHDCPTLFGALQLGASSGSVRLTFGPNF